MSIRLSEAVTFFYLLRIRREHISARCLYHKAALLLISRASENIIHLRLHTQINMKFLFGVRR